MESSSMWFILLYHSAVFYCINYLFTHHLFVHAVAKEYLGCFQCSYKCTRLPWIYTGMQLVGCEVGYMFSFEGYCQNFSKVVATIFTSSSSAWEF